MTSDSAPSENSELNVGTSIAARFWEDPGLTAVHRLPARATMTSWPDVTSARQLPCDQSPWQLSLDGDWRFCLFTRPEAAGGMRIS